MFEVATGVDSGSDDYSVGLAAASAAMDELRAKAPDQLPALALVFSSVKYNNEIVLSAIRSVVGESTRIVGASTAGAITAAGPTKRESVVVMLCASDTISFTTSAEGGITEDSHRAGKQLAEKLVEAAHDELVLAIMMADGLKGNGSAIIRGLQEVLGEQFPIVGGSAGDDGKFEGTEQYESDTVHTDSVAGIGVSGAIEFAVGVNHGWSPVGIPRKVTSAEGTKVISVDGEKAISLYEDYLGPEEVQNLKEQTLGEIALSYPLGIKDESSEEMLLRAPFAVGDDGSIICGGEIPEGSEVQLMVGTREDAVSAARRAAEMAMSDLGTQPKAAVIFSCHVRNTLFGSIDEAAAEVEAIQDVIGANVPLAGFYTYAEQAPVGGASRNIKKCNPEFHNETVVLLLLAEKN